MTMRCQPGLMLLLFPILIASVRAEERVATWERWEHRLQSDRAYESPCAEVQVRVQYQSPSGETREGLGFWDGDRQFVIRSVFATPGAWHWTTTCTDTTNQGLHGQSGVVQVRPATGENPFSRHGYLRVSDDGRLLIHADGTPFFWLGDTCWAAPVHATEAEWQQYVANRAVRGYTVLQLSIGGDWALEHSRTGIMPFLSTLPDISRPNPVYFQGLDRKLAEANDHGLAVVLVGLMETPYRYPSPEQVALFSRYVAARYASHMVIFSPSFDSNIHEDLTEASAQAIRQAAPDNLITMHMGTAVGPHFHAEEWLSFDMIQSGHNNGDRARQSALAVAMPAEVLRLAPRKPVVNGEAIYEGDLGGPADVRRTAWLSYLSGAVGLTAGINELYAWDANALDKMNLASSEQMTLLARILKALPWWTLEPAPARILNQPKDRTRWMAMAWTPDRTLALAYLPDSNGAISLDLSDCAQPFHSLWIDPARGRWREGPDVTPAAKATLRPPSGDDWLLVLTAPGADFAAGLQAILTVAAE